MTRIISRFAVLSAVIVTCGLATAFQTKASVSNLVGCGLTMKKQCGEIVCPEYHLCLEHDSQCYPCMGYCDEKSNNFDVKMCEQNCQDYIHDFVKHYVKHDDIKNALEKLETMQVWMFILIVMVSSAAVCVCVTLAIIMGRKKKMMMMKKMEDGGRVSIFKNKFARMQKKNRSTSANNGTATSDETAMEAVEPRAATVTETATTAAVSSVPSSATAAVSFIPSSATAAISVIPSSATVIVSSNSLPTEDITVISAYENLPVFPDITQLSSSPSLPVPWNQPHLHQYTPAENVDRQPVNNVHVIYNDVEEVIL